MATESSPVPSPAGARAPGPETWWRLHSGPGEPAWNMAVDQALLEAAPRLGRPVLRFYGWAVPAATFGYAQRYAEVERLTPLRPLIRRPTGGGVVPHDADWTYTLVFPPAHPWYALRARESYRRLHAWLRAALARLGVATRLAADPAPGAPTHCFQRAEQYDVLQEGGAKLAGAAQRRTRTGLLIQGSVQPPPGLSRPAWETVFCAEATAQWGVTWQPWEPDAALRAAAEQLVRTRYGLDAFNRRR